MVVVTTLTWLGLIAMSLWLVLKQRGLFGGGKVIVQTGNGASIGITTTIISNVSVERPK